MARTILPISQNCTLRIRLIYFGLDRPLPIGRVGPKSMLQWEVIEGLFTYGFLIS